MDKNTEWTNFLQDKREKDVPKPLINLPEVKKIITEHVRRKGELSENALVSLILFVNTGSLNEDYVKELNFFGLISDGEITDKGSIYINSAPVVYRLKTIIE